MNTFLAHDDAISQLSMQENLVSSSWDSTVKVEFQLPTVCCFGINILKK